MNQKLNPCPFCGEIPSLRQMKSTKQYYLFCRKCNIETTSFNDREEIIKYWNTRFKEKNYENSVTKCQQAQRLTTDSPVNITENMLNFAFAENGIVKLRYGRGKENIDLCEYIEDFASDDCCISAHDIMEGACLECDCDCNLQVLYVCSVQAAELRERLKYYENLNEQCKYSVDVAETKHGKWVKQSTSFDLCGVDYYKCSLCGKETQTRYPNCPWCTAKMDGVNND